MSAISLMLWLCPIRPTAFGLCSTLIFVPSSFAWSYFWPGNVYGSGCDVFPRVFGIDFPLSEDAAELMGFEKDGDLWPYVPQTKHWEVDRPAAEEMNLATPGGQKFPPPQDGNRAVQEWAAPNPNCSPWKWSQTSPDKTESYATEWLWLRNLTIETLVLKPNPFTAWRHTCRVPWSKIVLILFKCNYFTVFHIPYKHLDTPGASLGLDSELNDWIHHHCKEEMNCYTLIKSSLPEFCWS